MVSLVKVEFSKFFCMEMISLQAELIKALSTDWKEKLCQQPIKFIGTLREHSLCFLVVLSGLLIVACA